MFSGGALLGGQVVRSHFAVDAAHRRHEHDDDLPADVQAVVIVLAERLVDDSVSGEDERSLNVDGAFDSRRRGSRHPRRRGRLARLADVVIVNVGEGETFDHSSS